MEIQRASIGFKRGSEYNRKLGNASTEMLQDIIKKGSLCFIPFATVLAAKNDRPNIVLILADDLGFSDLGCYGSEINTPIVDSLANNGIRFSNFYNSARSCPSRASLLTGLYPHQAGMGDMVYSAMNKKNISGYQSKINNRCVTIAEVLKGNGYHTLMSGKWHLGDSIAGWPTRRGFDKYFGLISGASNYFNISKKANAGSERILASNEKRIATVSSDFYMTEAITDSAVAMINSIADDKPFFLYLSYTAPHWPLQARQSDIDQYKGKYDIGWDKIRQERYQKQLKIHIFDKDPGYSDRNEDVPLWDSLPDKSLAASKMEVYAAMVHSLDREVGKLLNYLKQQNLDQNTLVIFLSDNGACHEDGVLGFDRFNNGEPVGGANSFQSYGESWANVCNAPFRYFKQFTHEGGISNPAIFYWPEHIKPKGFVTKERAHLMDVMATILDVTNIKYPKTYNGNEIIPSNGVSLLPVLKGEKTSNRKYLAWEHEGNKAIMAGDWKCVKERHGNWELYNLSRDRAERFNLISKYPHKAIKLIKEYERWEKKVGVVEFE
ncbi:MAG: arylsulfatase [Bacteroidales bacterium]|nr:arylsulfatase [Bacteroidales bacterium]